MTERIPLPGLFDDQPFAVRDAVALGVGTARLRSADLESPFWGVRVPAATQLDEPGRAKAYLSRANPLTVVSHASAARMWGIPLPSRMQRDDRLHVTVPPDLRAPKAAGVAGHHVSLHPMDVVDLRNVRVTSQARTLCDLAGYLNEEDLLAATDFLLWWRRDEADRATRHDILEAITRHPTSRGMARMRSVEPLAVDRADSAPESIIRYRILKADLPTPAVNLEAFDSRGKFLAMPDLSFPDFRIAIEYEGDHHRTDAVQWEKDIHRVPRLQDAGWHPIRVSKSDLSDSHDFLARLARILHERGWRPHPKRP